MQFQLTQDGDAVQVLVTLLLIYFSPSTESMTHVRQCLAVAFEAYSRLHPENHRMLARAFLPAARQSMLMSATQGKGGKTITVPLTRFISQLLQAPIHVSNTGRRDHSHILSLNFFFSFFQFECTDAFRRFRRCGSF